MVELHKALDENAVCRSPLLDGHQARDAVRVRAHTARGWAAAAHTVFCRDCSGVAVAMRNIYAWLGVRCMMLQLARFKAQSVNELPVNAGCFCAFLPLLFPLLLPLLLLQLVGLYKLHIENTEVPPNFAVLLQLRQMLGLDADTAEQIEDTVLHQSQAFSI